MSVTALGPSPEKSHWVRSRQEQLEADLKRAWASDPLIIAGTK